jgi:iron(III) transport system substrate-binding protein
MEEAFNKKHGLGIRLNYTPSMSYPKIGAQAMLEHRQGVPATFDIIVGSTDIYEVIQSGAARKVEWSPLLPKGTPPEVVAFDSRALITSKDYHFMLYNSSLVAKEQVPMSWRDLADPKWRGKIILPEYPNTLAQTSLVFGKEEWLRILAEIAKNKPVLQTWAGGSMRLGAGEYPLMPRISSRHYLSLKERGAPVGYGYLDKATFGSNRFVLARSGARHPHAAVLFAAFLAGPEANKIWEKYENFNPLYPGSRFAEFQESVQRLGLQVHDTDGPEWSAFTTSEEGKRYFKKIISILR